LEFEHPLKRRSFRAPPSQKKKGSKATKIRGKGRETPEQQKKDVRAGKAPVGKKSKSAFQGGKAHPKHAKEVARIAERKEQL